MLMGASRPARGLARMRTPLPQQLMQLLPGVDVRIVADRREPRRGPLVTVVIVVIVAVVAAGVGVAIGFWLPPHGRRPSAERPLPVRRILLPFTGQEISRRAFEAAVRLAKAEGATIMPAFLARVPRNLPLDSPLPVQSADGMPLLEAIEQRAEAQASRSTPASHAGVPTATPCGGFSTRRASTG